MSRRFAVIDTETNWKDEVMSIGVLIARSKNFEKIDSRYYILPRAEKIGGMYSNSMRMTKHEILIKHRPDAIDDLKDLLNSNGVKDLLAYNASFDKRHLPMPCCGTGRLRRGYGVEQMLRILGKKDYSETHNAIVDARDELMIMKKLGYDIDYYPEI